MVRLVRQHNNSLQPRTATANTPCPYSPWVRPSPKQHAYLLFGFTPARANARMLMNAAYKPKLHHTYRWAYGIRQARESGEYSRIKRE